MRFGVKEELPVEGITQSLRVCSLSTQSSDSERATENSPTDMLCSRALAKTLTNKCKTLDVDPSDTIKKITKKVRDREGFSGSSSASYLLDSCLKMAAR